jgi:hypothetical protein
MASRHIYTPILKGKQNDLKALARLTADIRPMIKPLIEPPVPVKGEKLDDALEAFVGNIVKYLPPGPVFVDYYWWDNDQRTESGQLAAVQGFDMLLASGWRVTPVYAIGRGERSWDQMPRIVSQHGQGFCFRVDADQLEDATDATVEEISARCNELAISPSQIDVIVDLRDVRQANWRTLRRSCIDFLTALTPGKEYRSIAIAGSSTLKDVSAGPVPVDGLMSIERVELRLWCALLFDQDGATRPVLSDYTVVHPDFSASGPNPNQNAKIRYTHDGVTTYYRGHGLFRPVSDFAQYRTLATRVMRSAAYDGPGFSFGDEYLARKASGEPGTGSPGTWVLSDINHHVTHVARQIPALATRVLRAQSEEALEQLAL